MLEVWKLFRFSVILTLRTLILLCGLEDANMSRFIRTAYSMHCMAAHTGGFKPLTLRQFVTITFKVQL